MLFDNFTANRVKFQLPFKNMTLEKLSKELEARNIHHSIETGRIVVKHEPDLIVLGGFNNATEMSEAAMDALYSIQGVKLGPSTNNTMNFVEIKEL